MKCPRCETNRLDEKDREGVVVDACSQCRGLWLDRGELEKLIARAARDLDELAQRPVGTTQERSYPPPPERVYAEPERSHAPRARRDSDHDLRYGSDPQYRHDDPRYRHRKKTFIESLGDIFD